MKILLTGATGFIGSAILKLAVEQGHQVAALVRPGKSELPAHPDGVRVLLGTLVEAPWAELAAFQPEICIHAAWITTPGTYMESPENEQLVGWSQSFLRKAVQLGVRRVIALGTCIEYQMTGKPLAEETTLTAPVSQYARSKDTLRRRLEEASHADGFAFVWGRVFYPYGPGEHPARLCTSAIRQIHTGKPVVLQNGMSVKDYIFITDLASAVLTLAGGNGCGVINLGTGHGIALREVVQTIAELLGRPDLVVESTAAKPDPFGFVVADASRLRSLGWQPGIALRDGLQTLIQEVVK
jgi:nucleoside-diphosphate-sugar epimerase